MAAFALGAMGDGSVLGWLPLADPDATAQALDRLRQRGKLVGVRHFISNEPEPFQGEPSVSSSA